MIRPDCPVAEQVRDLGVEVRRMLLRLRRSMRECQICSIRDDCSLRCEVQALVRQAAEETLEELSE
jgi:hypothetical protein